MNEQNQPNLNQPGAHDLEKMKSWWTAHHILAYIVIGLLLLAIASVVLYFQVSKSVPEIGQTPVVHTDPTSTWKTYTNTKYGYSFKYPSDHAIWFGINQTNNTYILAQEDSDGATFSQNQDLDFCCESNQLSFQFYKTDLTPKQWITNEGKKQYPEITSFENVTFAGKAGIQMVGDGNIGSNYKEVVFPGQNGVFVIRQNFRTDTFNQIISTFKFTDSTSVDTSTWKTYTNRDLGFSIQYPADFVPAQEFNDQYNRLTIFDNPKSSESFEVRLHKADGDNSGLGVQYGWLDSQIISTNVPIAGVDGSESISETGYADAGSVGAPFVVFYARHNGDIYTVVFDGDAKVSDQEQKILSTFKFTN